MATNANAEKTTTTNDANKAYLADFIDPDLIVKPVDRLSVAAAVAKVYSMPPHVNTFRTPIISEDPTAAWVAEGDEISASEAKLDEATSQFHKLAGLSVVSSELVDDSTPDIARLIGEGLARDISRKIDAAYFGTAGSNQLQPQGLGDLTTAHTISAGTTLNSLDPFTEAAYHAETLGVALAAFVAHPDDALALAQLKDEADSLRPLLNPDPTQPSTRIIGGIPLIVSPAVTKGTIWGIPKDRTFMAIRTDIRLDVDKSIYFTSDRHAIRATMRVAFVYPQPEAVVKITVTPASNSSR